MLDLIGEPKIVALIGLIGGICLGLAARVGRFCTLGAIEDCLYSSDKSRFYMWGIAIGSAIFGVHLGAFFGLIDPTTTVYLDRVWNPLATVIGGLMFGYGMALSGNCGYGALARFGGGDLRSFLIVLVMGLSAYVVMSGPLAHLRIWLFPVELSASNSQGFSFLIEKWTGLKASTSGLIIGAMIILMSLTNRSIWRSPQSIFWASLIGAVIVSGWFGTYWVATAGFEPEPIETHTFAAPIGDTIFYAMTASGNALSFSVGSVLGVVVGAFIGALLKGNLRLEACDDPRELNRQIWGAVIMGAGAILAVGCSVGQGISAFSVLAYSAPVTFACIFVGATIGLKQLISGPLFFK